VLSDSTETLNNPNLVDLFELQEVKSEGDIQPQQLLNCYEKMITIRRLEDQILQLFKEGKLPASTHTSQGQEAVTVGLTSCLRPDDLVLGTYRGHGEAIAKGLEPKEILSEIFGKETGCCKGNGGSMHMSKREIGLIGTYSIVAAGLPSAVGLALASKLGGKDQVVVCFFGDGATNNGTFHEALNMAALWNAPVIFACVNNLYAEYSAVWKTTKVKDLATRASSYGMEGVICDGNDFFEVRRAGNAAVAKARRGEGPTLIEFKTYRRWGHSRLDDGSSYRPKDEVNRWFARDPIQLMKSELTRRHLLDESKDGAIVKRVSETIQNALEFAINSPYPPPSQAFENVTC
jgi:acetoin:2,6-dichlorophenolindophenol oxidoreductase subunit alpha